MSGSDPTGFFTERQEKSRLRKLIAVLRYITPSEVEGVCDILVESGFSMIEVTANTSNYLESLRKMVKRYSSTVMIGLGTVTTEEEVEQVHEVGGSFIVSPHTDPLIIAKTRSLDMFSLPGCFTPTEALIAVKAGSNSLKFFPASWTHPSAAKDIKAVLPAGISIYAVGGVGPKNFSSYRQGGFDGFGVGNSLYRPGISLGELRKNCQEIVTAYDQSELSL